MDEMKFGRMLMMTTMMLLAGWLAVDDGTAAFDHMESIWTAGVGGKVYNSITQSHVLTFGSVECCWCRYLLDEERKGARQRWHAKTYRTEVHLINTTTPKCSHRYCCCCCLCMMLAGPSPSASFVQNIFGPPTHFCFFVGCFTTTDSKKLPTSSK